MRNNETNDVEIAIARIMARNFGKLIAACNGGARFAIIGYAE